MKPKKLSSTCSSTRARDARVGEQPLQLARAGAVEAEAPARRDRQRQQAGAQRELHVQQHVEASAADGGAQRPQRAPAGALVHDDKLDAGEQAHQARLDPADHPGDACRGPGLLQRAHDRHDVAGVADGGQSEYAEAAGRRDGNRHALGFHWHAPMTVNWPVGPEVRVDAVRGGAMLYDTSYAGNVSAEWLSSAWWAGRGRVPRCRGRTRCGLFHRG